MTSLRKINTLILILLCLVNIAFHFYQPMLRAISQPATKLILQQETKPSNLKLLSTFESANAVDKINQLCKTTSNSMEKLRCSTALEHIGDNYQRKGFKQKALTVFDIQTQFDESGFSDFKVAELYLSKHQYDAAINHYQKSLKKLLGNASSTRKKAQHNLGLAYINKKMYRQAFNCFQTLAKQKVAIAQLNLATMYELGHGVPVDRKKAYAWAHLALVTGLDKPEYRIAAQQIKNAQYQWFRRYDRSGRAFLNAQHLAKQYSALYA